jgi:hypothetical protein
MLASESHMRYLPHMRKSATEKAYADSTTGHDAANRPRVGRRMEFPDKCIAALPPDTFARIARCLREREDRTDFLREAVERELQRRKG